MRYLLQLVKSLSPHWDPAEGIGLVGISAAESPLAYFMPEGCWRKVRGDKHNQKVGELMRKNVKSCPSKNSQ